MKLRKLNDIQEDLQNAKIDLINQQIKIASLQLEENKKLLEENKKLLKTKTIKTTIDKEFFEKWKDEDVVMWCKKEKYAKEFCKIMDENNLIWNTGESYLKDNYWDDYTIETAYSFNFGEYCCKEWYKNEGYTILDFEDYIIKGEKDRMTKKELVKLMVDNFIDEDGCLDLSGLDFSEYDCNVDIGNMKVSKNLFQDEQKVEGHLFQNRHMVGGDLIQGLQKVQGNLF